MAKDIWIIIEHSGEKIRKVSLELLSQARIIADQAGENLVAVILGENIEALVSEVAAYGADKVILVDDPRLTNYATGAYTAVLHRIIRQDEPQVVLLGHTSMTKDLTPRLAQRLGVGLASDCTGMEFNPAMLLKLKRPVYSGKAFAFVSTECCPIIATVRP